MRIWGKALTHSRCSVLALSNPGGGGRGGRSSPELCPGGGARWRWGAGEGQVLRNIKARLEAEPLAPGSAFRAPLVGETPGRAAERRPWSPSPCRQRTWWSQLSWSSELILSLSQFTSRMAPCPQGPQTHCRCRWQSTAVTGALARPAPPSPALTPPLFSALSRKTSSRNAAAPTTQTTASFTAVCGMPPASIPFSNRQLSEDEVRLPSLAPAAPSS